MPDKSVTVSILFYWSFVILTFEGNINYCF